MLPMSFSLPCRIDVAGLLTALALQRWQSPVRQQVSLGDCEGSLLASTSACSPGRRDSQVTRIVGFLCVYYTPNTYW
jgi:hypothetical protein